MAAGGAAATTTHLKIQSHTPKPRRRRYREITISSSASATTDIVEAEHSSDSSLPPPQSPPHPYPRNPDPNPDPDLASVPNCYRTESSVSVSPQNQRYRYYQYSPSSSYTINNSSRSGVSTLHTPPMDYSPSNGNIASFPSSFSKFNSALTAGLLNPMSPPPQTPPQTPPNDKTSSQSSPTLFEMMANESDCHPKGTTNQVYTNGAVSSARTPATIVQDRHFMMQNRVFEILGNRSPGSQFNDPETSDIKLTLSSKDGFSVVMNVHRQILVGHSRFFAGRLTERWVKQQRETAPFAVEIADCDDVEVYVETLRLMYCKDLRRKLMKDDVRKVLGILKVSAAIGFDAGVLSCLEYLEAAPWAEDEEAKVAALLSELQLEGAGVTEVLKRVSMDVASTTEDSNDNEEVLMKLLQVVLEGKDEKARREMKGLVSKMLRENANQNDLRKESLYAACERCLQQLRSHLLRATSSDLQDVGQIARQAQNLHWLLDILVDRQIAEDFLQMWASETDMSSAHSKVPAVHRYEVSRVTARLFVGIGKGQLLASKDARCTLLQTWLGAFYADFGWMRRASKGLDRHSIENGLSDTILTLPLSWQQDIFLAWFDRFLNSGDDCPNIQRGFEVWWRRAFWRRIEEPSGPRVRVVSFEN